MKKKYLWFIPQILICFTLISIPVSFAQFTTSATSTSNIFSTAGSFVSPSPSPTLTPSPNGDDADCDEDDPCATPTTSPVCKDCDGDCDKGGKDDKCKPRVIVHCDTLFRGENDNKSDQDKYSKCEDEKHKTHLIFSNNSIGFFVTFTITEVKNFKHLKYDLQYIHSGIIEDIQGTGITTSDKFTSDPIQLGTCSTTACINHKDAHDFKLTITLQGSTYHKDHHDGKNDHDVSFEHDGA